MGCCDFELITWVLTPPTKPSEWVLDPSRYALAEVAWANFRTQLQRTTIGTLRVALLWDEGSPPLAWDLDPVLRTVPAAGPTGADDWETVFGAPPLRLPACRLRMGVFIEPAPLQTLDPKAQSTLSMVVRRRS